MEPEEIPSWLFSSSDFDFDYDNHSEALFDCINSTPSDEYSYVNPNETMTGTYQVMKQDQQFVFQPSQLTVMACKNKGDNDDEGKKDGESTHDRLDEKVTADNDLEEIGSKHNSPLAMMEPISKFDASLTCFHTLDGKNFDMHTAEGSISIATMSSPFSTSSMSRQSSGEM
jgi:hypothetical protein